MSARVAAHRVTAQSMTVVFHILHIDSDKYNEAEAIEPLKAKAQLEGSRLWVLAMSLATARRVDVWQNTPRYCQVPSNFVTVCIVGCKLQEVYVHGQVRGPLGAWAMRRGQRDEVSKGAMTTTGWRRTEIAGICYLQDAIIH